jgi:hypothetical protein
MRDVMFEVIDQACYRCRSMPINLIIDMLKLRVASYA